MTGAGFDTRRRALGLSISETAAVCGPVNERTVNRWINDHSSVPPDALASLDALEEAMEKAVDRLVAIATDQTMAGPIQIRRYRTQDDLAASPDDIGIPLGAHAMMTAWLDDQLAAQGIETEIVWADLID
ncbi:MAG: helix-turn-helix transcriptional regulator [Bosea sp.]|uniref:hypothetical protein n=1 Tax=Bosea sp. (in: a-proteobacteria) TaxID=1871050 RepID=UPI002396A79E|nr:helix-turn-helix transcriptional regulator [Bosea sp. (in: a-proteobacteria)]MCP4738435.1 helix-turn-helix transcriptional regulator [Bosea sp. (in: a-proteobacteria)]